MIRFLVLFLIAMGSAPSAMAFLPQGLITDPGFESHYVETGEREWFSDPWVLRGDSLVVRPHGGPTAAFVRDNVEASFWDASVEAFEGSQYASTYAGGDYIEQPVTISEPGAYRLSVYAFSRSGSVAYSGELPHWDLREGAFTFIVDGDPIGDVHYPQLDAPWTQFSASFEVAIPGEVAVGVSSARSGRFYINYDQLLLAPIPEPSTLSLAFCLACGSLLRRRR